MHLVGNSRVEISLVARGIEKSNKSCYKAIKNGERELKGPPFSMKAGNKRLDWIKGWIGLDKRLDFVSVSIKKVRV